jgi:hypothetical protein
MCHVRHMSSIATCEILHGEAMPEQARTIPWGYYKSLW